MRLMGLAAAVVWAMTSPASAQVPGPPPGALMYGCGTPEVVEADALSRLTSAVPSQVERQVELDAAHAAIDKVAELRRDAMAGKPVEPPYREVSRFAALAASAGSDELAELYRRVAEDQFTRFHFTAVMQGTNWAAGLSDHAKAYAYYVIGSQGCNVDADNTRWLKEQVGRSGWFVVSKYGVDADRGAWLLVQHADRDVAFQAEVLSMLEPLSAVGETDPKSYAYLYDRVAVNSQRPQRYGTQGRCTAAGTWEPREVEAPEQLDERRAAVGLPPEAEYIAVFTCPKARS